MDSLLGATWFVFMCSCLVTLILILYFCTQSNKVVTAAKEGAFKATVEWFINYMQ